MKLLPRRRWPRFTVIGLLTIVLLIGAGLAFWLWKIVNGVKGSYDENQITSVLRYSNDAPSPPPQNRSRENPLFVNEFSVAGFVSPDVKYRPWTRWWWPGNHVRADELRREVRLLKDHSFGGAEVQPFTISVNLPEKSPEANELYSFDTQAYYLNLGAVLNEAAQQDFKIDLTVGSGWPPGGAQISPEDNVRTLGAGEMRVKGGTTLNTAIPKPKATLYYYVLSLAETIFRKDLGSFFAANAKPIAVIAAKITRDGRSWNPVNLSDQVGLDPESLVDLTGHVGPDSKLSWQVPDGNWMIIAFYQMSGGVRPMAGCAEWDCGYVMDYFDSERISANYNYLFGNRTGLPQYYSKVLRAVFNDSLELTVDRHITRNFLPVFKEQRGYDLAPYLPTQVAPGYDNYYLGLFGFAAKPKYVLSAEDDRIRYDYSLTVSDLFQRQFLDPTMQWADRYGLLTRTQAYGLKVDVIKSSGHVHIPETEALYAGGSEMSLRMVSSGAHLYNRPVVSSETFVHQDLDYTTTPQKLRLEANKLFAAGVNHIIHHGTPYRMPDKGYGETGWSPFSSGMGHFSSNASEADPFWSDIKQTNEFIARCQYVLRQGKPRTEVLVYYPFLGFGDDLGMGATHKELYMNGLVPGVDRLQPPTGLAKMFAGRMAANPSAETVWLRKIWPVIQELDRAGLSWDWVNDESLQEALVRDRQIEIRGNRYGAILLAEEPWMQLASAENLVKLADSGARIWIRGAAPQRQPGFFNYKENDRRIAALLQQVSSKAAKWLEPVPQEISYAAPYDNLQQITRQLPDGGLLMFLWNASDQDSRFELTSRGQFVGYYWLDAEDGSAYAAHVDSNRLKGELGPYRSTILYAARRPFALNARALPLIKQVIDPDRIAERIALQSWEFEVKDGPHRTNTTLTDWRTDPALKYVAAQATYRASFDLNSDPNQSYLLDLGKVFFTAAVKVNGKDAGKLVAAPYRADITGLLQPGKNSIEIVVTPGLRNRLIGRAEAGDQEYRSFKGVTDTLLPSGLAGPVEVWRIAR